MMALRRAHAMRACVCGLLLISMSFMLFGAEYSWQDPHAVVLPNGDLQYAPHSFTYSPGGSVVYIDYEAGSDANDGSSPGSALKHHPWDANAGGNAASMSGVKTYVFKRGVIYRGKLVADESGQEGSPIILTSDPSWGQGEAKLYGSERISGGWARANASTAPHVPNPEMVWYINLPFAVVDNPYGSYPTYPEIYPQMVAEVTDTGLARIRLARAPNWEITDPNYPLKDWWDVLWVGNRTAQLPESFSVSDNTVWTRGTIWTTWGRGTGAGANMATINQGKIKNYASGTIQPEDGLWMDLGNKYFIENMPFLLDTPNEFYCTPPNATPASRLYVRLSGDRDPNLVDIEVGVRPDIIDIVDKSNITISGLTLGMNNNPRPSAYTPEPPHWNTRDGSVQAIELSGECSNITISNCKFRHVVMAIAPRRDENSAPQKFDNVRILDNDMAHVDDQAIVMGSREDGYMRNIEILRNKITNVGERQISRWYSSIQAINVQPATSAHIAGNFVHYAYGSGINYSAEEGTTGQPGDQVKVLVHHNKVTFSLLGLNDYGGIEAWEDGPGFIYNNISGNPRGFRPFSGDNVYNPWGGAIYVDHGNAQRVFNNICWGVHNDPVHAYDRNPTGFMQAVSERSFFANNTTYMFYRAVAAVVGNNGVYVGNIHSDASSMFECEAGDLTREAYAKNVYYGSPEGFSNQTPSFGGFVSKLSSGGAWTSSTGLVSSSAILVDPANGDFRPTGDAIGNGCMIFMPWNLVNVVGEWGFQKNEGNVSLVIGTDATDRSEGDNDLTMNNVQDVSYVQGPLEDWTAGALHFNGSNVYGTVASSSTFDAGSGSLILEAYVRTTNGGPVMSKGGAAGGYALSVEAGGPAVFTLGSYSLRSAGTVGDGNWHHVVAELDRSGGQANLYVDGAQSNGTSSGTLPASASTGTAFYVGREGNSYFDGDVDFARVAKGSFADGATSYDELYAWEFEGPARRDFLGTLIEGSRDAGALNFNTIGIHGGKPAMLSPTNVNVRYLHATRRLLVRVGGDIDAKTPVQMSVLTPAGRVVHRIQATVGELGAKSVASIDASPWASGVYLVRVKMPKVEHIQALSLFK